MSKNCRYLLLSLFLVSCLKPEEIRTIDVGHSRSLEGKLIKLSENILRSSNMIITGDKLVFHDQAEGEQFKIFRIPDFRSLGKFGLIGDGPDEFKTIIDINQMHSGFRVLDGLNEKEFGFDGDSVFLIEQSRLFDRQGVLNCYCRLNEYLVVASAHNSQESKIYQHVKWNSKTNEVAYFGEYPAVDEKFNSQIEKALYFRNSCVINEKAGKFVIFYQFLNLSRIYDFDGNLLDEVKFSFHDFVPSSTNDVVHFVEPVASPHYIYVLYINKSKDQIFENSNSTYLLVLDWNSAVVDFLKLDQSIVTFALFDQEQKIYCLDFGSQEGGQRLFEYNLSL